MPGGDQTGPLGFGRMTGRGAGYCAGYSTPGYVWNAFKTVLRPGRGGWYLAPLRICILIMIIVSVICSLAKRMPNRKE